MNMNSVIFWIATALIALEALVGGVTDLVHGGTYLFAGTPVVDVVTGLGYPVYILRILGTESCWEERLCWRRVFPDSRSGRMRASSSS
jgi:hypothetical protein